MAIGQAATEQRFEDAAMLIDEHLPQGSIYRLLAEEGHRLFPDDYFADLFTASARGRPTVPARVVATAMLLQSFEGLSDREACDHLRFDLRWLAAAGLHVGADAFDHTLLVMMRNRLRASERPRRLFEDTVVLAKRVGVVRSRIRVVDSTPLYDAVATQDTVTQLRAAIRKVLRCAPVVIEQRIRQRLRRDDRYDTPGKPPCDWDDPQARDQLIDALVRDALAVLDALDGVMLPATMRDAVDLLALVAGQDVAQSEDGVFRIVRGVAKDRVISTVDPEARHGHKSQNRRFDGYKTHLATDPESEIYTEVAVTPANAPDRAAVSDLVHDLTDTTDTDTDTEDETDTDLDTNLDTDTDDDEVVGEVVDQSETPMVVGDSAYADAATRTALRTQGIDVMAKVPPTRNSTGGFSKDAFTVDLTAGTVTCPATNTVPIVFRASGAGRATFGTLCVTCPLAASCTSSRRGRQISIHPQETELQQARTEQREPSWLERYRANRPTAERAIAHFTRRIWGGRKARCRGVQRVTTDALTRAGVLNLARMATLGLRWSHTGWTIA